MSFEFSHPHFSQVYEGGAALSEAEVVVIGFHGRGGNVDGIYNKMDQAVGDSKDVAFLAPRAVDRLWFRDQFVAADDPQLLKSLDAVAALIKSLNDRGISSDQIVLVGQSQGAVLVDEYLASTGIDVRAAVSWSGALVGPFYEEVASGQINPLSPNPLKGLEYDLIPKEYRGVDLTGQTIQIAVHEADPKVPLEMVLATADYYRSQGAQVEMHVEPGTSHKITDYDVSKLADTVNYNRDASTFETEKMSGGRFATAVVETHRNDPSDSRVVVKVHNKDGYSTSKSEFFVDSTKGTIDAVDMVVLDNGNLAFVLVGSDDVMKAAIYDVKGSLIAETVLAANVDAASLDAAATADGFEVQYTSVYGNENTVSYDAEAGPVNIVLAGTKANETIIGTSGEDQMFGYRGHDVIKGRGSDDVIRGGNGRDTLEGDGGNDRLIGQGGDDVLDGGAGDNKLIGGKGADFFVVDGSKSISRIMDFETGVDTILIKTETDDFSDIDVRQQANGTDLLTFEDAKLFVRGDFSESDILFA